MEIQKLIGIKIKEFRKLRNMTQEELAEKAGLDAGYISKLEVGRNFPKIQTLVVLSEILGVNLADFFELSAQKNLDFKLEISKILEDLSPEKQILLYQVAKSLK